MSTGSSTGLETSSDQTPRVALAGDVSVSKARSRIQIPPSEAVNDRYRCPEGLLDIASSGPLSSSAGFFRFGQSSICYGRSRATFVSSSPESSIYDAAGEVAVEGTKLLLPFNLKEVIESLRLESYRNGEVAESSLFRLCKRLYYYLRPFTNQTVRKQVQKFHARNWKKRAFPQWPVDTTVENVFETVLLMSMKAGGLERVPFVWFWPNGSNSCLTMTHDVETKAGRDFCPALMDLDDAFGIKGAFGIVPEKRYEVPKDLLESMQSRGFEVVVQDLYHDGRLFDDKQEFLRRAKIINHYGREFSAAGFRAAVLYRKPEWYDALDFAFDMSFPNVAPLDPQQGGCCTVMPFFIGDMLEIPVTTVQDYTLFHVLNERSIELWKAQTDLILKKNGLLSFIVHPDYVLRPDTLAVYKQLLGHLQGLREKTPIWCALPSEINAWWRARNKMSVVRDGASWRIVGEGCERAVLAYAKNVDGKIAYEVPGPARPQ
ncbi:MAG TPA: hypothetical protein VJN89_20440 [Candidatus Acidoferrum sp.]|nr:hypothetical protein [Candidatus Acidoferrum sp.]